MQDKVTFEYAIIRLVPKVEREEFFNIGVILFSKQKKFLGVKYKINEAKLNAFSCELDVDAINNYLGSWDLICKGDSTSGVIGQFELSDRFRSPARPKLKPNFTASFSILSVIEGFIHEIIGLNTTPPLTF